jgi:hypothetical protein
MGTSRKLFLQTEYNNLLIVMERIFKDRIETEEQLILETGCNEAISSD